MERQTERKLKGGQNVEMLFYWLPCHLQLQMGTGVDLQKFLFLARASTIVSLRFNWPRIKTRFQSHGVNEHE